MMKLGVSIGKSGGIQHRFEFQAWGIEKERIYKSRVEKP